jgi:hypothetical protein
MLPFSTGGIAIFVHVYASESLSHSLIKIVLNHIALLFFESVLA